MQTFLHSFQSEWLKRRRSAATALVWTGAFFIPLIILISRFDSASSVASENTTPHLWEALYGKCWRFMGLFLLPMGVILATSLVTQLEFKNNTWKQLHVTPQSLATIFRAKLAVIIVMLLQFFILFNIGIYLAGVIPGFFITGAHYPAEAFPLLHFLKGNAWFFLDCLPILALQYLVSLLARNFLIPLGLGIGLYVASMMAVIWRHGYIVPYAYCALEFAPKNAPGSAPSAAGHAVSSVPAVHTPDFHGWALAWFVVFTVVSYILYLTKKDKS